MPTCSKCDRLDATVELRRSPKKGEAGQTVWLCKDRDACKARRRAKRALLRSEKGAAR